jgi:phospholipid/cholesterol/gamma-HCH transport system ATP-binding protein
VTPGDSSILRFEDVSLHFDATVALDHVSFEMHPGQTYVVFGAAGSGKTMLLKVAVGLVQPNSGKVWLFGEEITHLREQDLFDMRARVGILFQEGGLFDSLTVAENVAYPLTNQRALRRAMTAGGSNGGGMRRRVGIARAVVSEPALLLYDSPTAGLDPITANTIVALILKERDLRNTATIMVTHRYQDGHLMANFRYNPNSGQVERAGGGGDVSQVSTKFLVMNEGRLVFEGTEPELQASQDAYVRKFLRVGGA